MTGKLYEERDIAYTKRAEQISRRISDKEKISNRISNIRFILFLFAIGVTVLTATLHLAVVVYLVPAVFFLAFLITALYHAGIKRELSFLQMLGKIQNEYIARTRHDFSCLQDDGSSFFDQHHDFAGDLDLFGPHSLFHLLSVANTWFGRETFAEYLLTAERKDISLTEILERQEAIKELSPQISLMQEVEAAGRLSQKSAEDPRLLLAYFKENDGPKSPIRFSWLVLSAISSICFLVSGILAWIFLLIPAYIPAAFVVLQLILIAVKFQRFRPIFASVCDFQGQLLSYSELFKTVEKTDVHSDYLKRIQGELRTSNTEKDATASQCVKKLHIISLFSQARSQPILFFVLNLLFQYDAFCVFALEKWKRMYGFHFQKYLEALGRWEAVMSLSTITGIYPDGAFPSFIAGSEEGEQRAYFVAEDMGHPLIPVNRQIRNAFSLPHGIALITGSNMSGKTTLLRTVGINAVLAYAGTVCCAEKISLGMMQIGSSMRIADDLREGVSTFYAELIRIEKIISKAKEGGPLLFLIDEIFRGTNSRDRTDGAKIVLKNLSHDHVIGLMSTHDYELCSSENQANLDIVNYHFSESYDEESIHFDYKLQNGISTSTNARFLMRLIGIE